MDKDTDRRDQFEKIIVKYSYLIRSIIQKHDPDRFGLSADDVCQEVVGKLWIYFKNEKKIERLATYISRVTNGVIIDHIRKIRRHQRLIEQKKREHRVADADQNYSDRRAEIDAALDRIGEKRRTPVRFFLLGLTIQEISGILKWSEPKTRNLVYRGLGDLKNELKNANEKDDE
ncbi:MAG: sigma-70 family RNA polymerase sigma factor [Acidobacteria bacterium]|nr:sigma-70 family RNA polymerase sigma factor [Acidobacteriota bacterium]MBU4255597.1 sigma-70 family RNA polymerase sigma factor [Acidobacteriota bacterium]